MFVRCATLTFHKFQKESIIVQNSQLLEYMSNQTIRANLIAKLIELITPETLNQVYILANWKMSCKTNSKENVSCLNTSLVFMITARRQKNLPFYLSDLSRRQNSDGVPLLENYQV